MAAAVGNDDSRVDWTGVGMGGSEAAGRGGSGATEEAGVTTRYGLLHYANLIRRTGPYLFSLSTYLI
jgi:hypothetical protein